MRIPQSLLEAVKTKAASKGVPFTRYVRMLIEQDIARPK
jgi:predicted DNA binding CopG/RHH family protein